MNQGIKSFTELDTWKKGHALVVLIYKLTKRLPLEEKYLLIDQMRRCAISITSNIAEGFSRKSFKEKLNFYSMALGSCTELQNQLLVCRDIGYISHKEFLDLANLTVEVNKLINGLMKSTRKYIN